MTQQNNCAHTFRTRRVLDSKTIVAALLFAGSLCFLTSLSAEVHISCNNAETLFLNQPSEIQYEPAEFRQIFEVNVDEPGLLHLELFPRFTDPSGTRIEGLSADCSTLSSPKLVMAEHTPGRILAKVQEPGRYFISVRTSPLMPEGRCNLRASLAPGVELQLARDTAAHPAGGSTITLLGPGKVEEGSSDGGDLGSGDIFPIWTPLKSSASLVTKIDEYWSDGGDLGSGAESPWRLPRGTKPGRLSLSEPGVLEIALRDMEGTETLVQLAPGDHSFQLRSLQSTVRLYSPCNSQAIDDHADTFSCATEIDWGDPMPGRIVDASSSDHDVFYFTLSTSTEVTLETFGMLDTQGHLFDEHGGLIATSDDEGEVTNIRLTETLGPGRYYLSVSTSEGSVGSYSLLGTTFSSRVASPFD